MKTLADARVLAETMIELGRRAGRRGRLPADRHGPAARPRGRQRARGARGARDGPRRGPAPTSPSSSSTRARACSRSPTSAIDEAEGRRRAEAGGRRRLGRGRRLAPLDRGAGRRPDPRTRCRRRRSSATVTAPRDGVRHAARRDPRSATPPSHLGAGRRTKDDPIDHAVGVVCLRKRGDAVARGRRRSPRCTPATRLGRRGGRRGARGVRARGRAAGGTRGAVAARRASS